MTEWTATGAVLHLLLARFIKLALTTTDDSPPRPPCPPRPTPHPQSVAISWPRSSLSNPVCFACLAGVATYVCVAHLGYWDPQGPDLSNCTSPWVNHIMQKVSLNDAAAGFVVQLPPENVSCGRSRFSPAQDAATAGKDLGHTSVFICSPQYPHFDAQNAASLLRRREMEMSDKVT